MTVRMRHTRSQTKSRRSHHALVKRNILKDKESGSLRLPHRIDEATGMYKGMLIAPKKVKKEKVTAEKVSLEGIDTSKKAAKSEEKIEKKKGLVGRMVKGKAKARSGMGGGV